MKQIKIKRAQFDIKQRELAKKVGISQAGISRIESGAAHPSLKVLEKLAKVFNCTIDELVNNETAEKST